MRSFERGARKRTRRRVRRPDLHEESVDARQQKAFPAHRLGARTGFMEPKLLSSVLVARLVVAPSCEANADASSQLPISIRIALSRTSVIVGTPIRVEASRNNFSVKSALVHACALDGWPFVRLANKLIPFQPAVSPAAPLRRFVSSMGPRLSR